MALLAALYVVTGKLGLLLAVPPGYATIIWPASGIAIGMLLVHGARLWPGVLLGSCLLNAYHSGVFADGAWLSRQAARRLLHRARFHGAGAGRPRARRALHRRCRCGSTPARDMLLVLAARRARHLRDRRDDRRRHAVRARHRRRRDVVGNWLAWWSGDSLGVLVFMPLVLLAPGGRAQITWRGDAIGQLPFAALLLLLLPLGLTFYAWKVTTENDYQRGDAKFETLSIESEKALQNRLASYGNALLGAAGFIQGSTEVSRDGVAHLHRNHPGARELSRPERHRLGRAGRARAPLPQFLRRRRADGAPRLRRSIRRADGRPNYIITLRRAARPRTAPRSASTSRSNASGWRPPTWRATRAAPPSPGASCSCRTKNASAGFLMLYPIYHRNMPTGTVDGAPRGAARLDRCAVRRAQFPRRRSPTARTPTTGCASTMATRETARAR